MKVYICRRGRPDFICQSPTVADAIITYWLATGETPKASYRVHHGRRRQARRVSSAIAYWRLGEGMRSLLCDVLKEQSTADAYAAFCEQVLEASRLLGK